MRARLAIASAGLAPEHREILLRDKAPEFLAASPKGTVPVVVDADKVIDESFDVMLWALGKSDPEQLLDMPDGGHVLIRENDSSFKDALDRTKYATRFTSDPEAERAKAHVFLDRLSETLGEHTYLFGERPKLADFAILPFIRQFANIERSRFDADAPDNLRHWLDRFLASQRFGAIMNKYPKWVQGDAVTLFLD